MCQYDEKDAMAEDTVVRMQLEPHIVSLWIIRHWKIKLLQLENVIPWNKFVYR